MRPYLRNTLPSARCSSMNSRSWSLRGPVAWMTGRAGPGPTQLALHELELRLVLRVGRLALHEHLEHGGGLPELSLLDVGLGELRVGREEARLVRELLVDLDQPVQRLHVGRALLHDLLQERGRA